MKNIKHIAVGIIIDMADLSLATVETKIRTHEKPDEAIERAFKENDVSRESILPLAAIATDGASPVVFVYCAAGTMFNQQEQNVATDLLWLKEVAILKLKTGFPGSISIQP